MVLTLDQVALAKVAIPINHQKEEEAIPKNQEKETVEVVEDAAHQALQNKKVATTYYLSRSFAYIYIYIWSRLLM